jgi:hypothetical protein
MPGRTSTRKLISFEPTEAAFDDLCAALTERIGATTDAVAKRRMERTLETLRRRWRDAPVQHGERKIP